MPSLSLLQPLSQCSLATLQVPPPGLSQSGHLLPWTCSDITLLRPQLHVISHHQTQASTSLFVVILTSFYFVF